VPPGGGASSPVEKTGLFLWTWWFFPLKGLIFRKVPRLIPWPGAKEGHLEPKKTLICTCEKCGNEAKMTVKCEVAAPQPAPAQDRLQRTVVCTRCGNEADLIVDYEKS
jgi:hypothetical protein